LLVYTLYGIAPVVAPLNVVIYLFMTNFDLKFSTLKAYGPESDIDVLCIGPYIATLQVSVNFVFCLC
jgi:hypothetical protein